MALHEDQDRFAVLFPDRLHALFHVVWRVHRALLHLDDDVAGFQAAFGRLAVRRDLHDHNALLVVGELVLVLQVGGNGRDLQPESQQIHGRGGIGLAAAVRRGELSVAGLLRQRGGDGDFLTVAPYDDGNLLTHFGFRDKARQGRHVLHLLPIESKDDVAVADFRLIRRAAIVHAGDHRAGDVLQADAFSDILRYLLDANAEPAADRVPDIAQLRHDGLHHLGRDGEPDAHRSAGAGVDRGVHADDLAVHVEQRAARVTLVDGGVGLDEVVVRALVYVTIPS